MNIQERLSGVQGRALAGQEKKVPWGNCRLVLKSSSEETLLGGHEARGDGYVDRDNESFRPKGIVGRLYFSPASHPAIRQALEGLEVRHISLSALAVQNLMNNRGPDALVGSIPNEKEHSGKLLRLCEVCDEHGWVLSCRMKGTDVVLVPRKPLVAAQDSLYFIAYATNILAVELCETLRSQKQVAIVFDIDNTLVDASAVTLSEQDWESLQWIYTTVWSSSGREIPGQFAHLPGSELEDARQDRAFVIHWNLGHVACTFLVRVRRGWGYLRAFLRENLHRFSVFVCSKGKLEYVQLIWQGLDPGSRLISQHEWSRRITSTFPDHMSKAEQKTALIALGCAGVGQEHDADTHLAAPIICIDDSPEAYEDAYHKSLLTVEEYRPSEEDGLADFGSVLDRVQIRLEDYWQATCGEAGTFAWQAAQSFSTAILGAMQKTPMESADALAYLQVRCAKQGELLARQITVESVLGKDAAVYEKPLEEASSPNSPVELQPSPQGKSGLGSPMVSLDSIASMFAPLPPEEKGRAASRETDAVDTEEGSKTADELLNAAMMMRC